jgi:hypothetical protein
MSCCGQKRQALVTESRPANRPQVASQPAPVRREVAQPSPAGNTVTLQARHASSLTVLGTVTGKTYRFSGGKSMSAVDRRDAEGLLSTGFFERVWG